MNEKLKLKLLTLPNKPGCYQMLDKDGKIIYVGKAINLKNRVNSYFRGSHDFKTSKLVMNIVDFEYIVTKSEKEALILEYNLIKNYDPPFNIIFKDDKSYPYILLDEGDIPYVKSVRINKKTKYKGKLYGPYPDIRAANNTVSLINKLFPSRKCKTLTKDYCLYYHIGQCLGYCQKSIDQKLTNDLKRQIEQFLKGDNKAILQKLQDKMDLHSSQFEFEKAMECRDLMNDIKYVTSEDQSVQVSRRENFDVFDYYTSDNYLSIVGFFIRDGRLINRDIKLMTIYGDPEEEFISYLYQFYNRHIAPKELVLSKQYDIFDFKTTYYSRGFKHEMLKKAHENAVINFNHNKSIIEKDQSYLEDIAKAFKQTIGFIPKRIELFDNSHLGFQNTCSAMVVYEDLKINKNEYRLYRLQDDQDDLASMKEVIYRRYFKVLHDDLKRPDLIIVDGGENQIKTANKIIQDLELDIPLFGLKKDEHHNTSVLINSKLEKIAIDPQSKLFFFLTNMQDEVHRFVINYNRKLRKKKMYASKLDDIPGLGKKRRNLLLAKFKTISNIEDATIKQLSEFIPNNVAINVYNKLHREGEE